MKLSNILDEVSDGIIQLDNDFGVVYINKQAGKLTNESFFLAISKKLDEVKKNKMSLTFEYYFKEANDWYEVRVYPCKQGIFIFLLNESEKKASEVKLEKSLRYLENIEAINEIINQTQDLDRMMSGVLDKVINIFNCDRAWLFYPAVPFSPTWRVPMERFRPQYPGAFVRNKDLEMNAEISSAIKAALCAKEPVVYDQKTGRQVPKPIREQFHVLSQIIEAIYPRIGKPWVFGLHQCSYPRIWSDEDKDLFAEIGYRITDSLNAILYSQQIKKSEERYRSISTILQKSLLPADIPQIKGLKLIFYYRPAYHGDEVGGDFYDVFKIPDGSYGIVMGDVSGKGIEAAAETAKVRYLLRDKAYVGLASNEVIKNVNSAIFMQKTPDVFTALTFAKYDSKTATISISNASNPYSYLVKEDKFIKITGVPIAINQEEEYDVIEVVLNKGDALIMFTDGLSEARHKGQIFGEERIRGFIKKNNDLSLDKLIKGLVEEASSFAHGNLVDDVLIIGLKKV